MKGQNLSTKRCFNLVSAGFVMCARGWLFIYFFGKMKLFMLCMNFEEFSKNGSLPSLCFLLLQRRNCVCLHIKFLPFSGIHIVSLKFQMTYIRLSLSRNPKDSMNTSRYPYFDISDLPNCGKLLIEQPPLTEWICNLTPKLEIYRKYCEKEEKLLLRSNFSLFPQYFDAYW